MLSLLGITTTLDATLQPISTLLLPEAVVQPSGIAHDMQSDSVLINTDQAEFFALSPDLAEAVEPSGLSVFNDAI